MSVQVAEPVLNGAFLKEATNAWYKTVTTEQFAKWIEHPVILSKLKTWKKEEIEDEAMFNTIPSKLFRANGKIWQSENSRLYVIAEEGVPDARDAPIEEQHLHRWADVVRFIAEVSHPLSGEDKDRWLPGAAVDDWNRNGRKYRYSVAAGVILTALSDLVGFHGRPTWFAVKLSSDDETESNASIDHHTGTTGQASPHNKASRPRKALLEGQDHTEEKRIEDSHSQAWEKLMSDLSQRVQIFEERIQKFPAEVQEICANEDEDSQHSSQSDVDEESQHNPQNDVDTGAQHEVQDEVDELRRRFDIVTNKAFLMKTLVRDVETDAKDLKVVLDGLE